MTIALISEARGEFVFLERLAHALRERLGPSGALQIEMDPLDLTPAERARTLVPATEPEFRAALQIPVEDLPARIAEAEEKFALANLRRLWRGDIQFWRDGVPEHVLARQALGYLEVFDKLHREQPELVGGFAEESARLIKRAFRAVSAGHDRRMLISITLPVPRRIILVDQEDVNVDLPAWDGFDPTPQQRAEAAAYIERVVTGAQGFGGARDLSLTPRKVTNFVRLVRRSVRPTAPGDHNARPAIFARDYVRQRLRVDALKHLASPPRDRERAVFFPLHHNNDSSLTIRGEGYRDQLALIQQLANALPYGYALWVKPHPHSSGDLPVTTLARLQRRLPNLRLLRPFTPVRDIFDRVSAVVTVNSTAGFEALVRGIPVVTLGQSNYRGRGLTVDVHDPFELSRAIGAAVHGTPPDAREVERLVAYFFTAGFEMDLIGSDSSDANAARYADALLERFGLTPRAALAR